MAHLEMAEMVLSLLLSSLQSSEEMAMVCLVITIIAQSARCLWTQFSVMVLILASWQALYGGGGNGGGTGGYRDEDDDDDEDYNERRGVPGTGRYGRRRYGRGRRY